MKPFKLLLLFYVLGAVSLGQELNIDTQVKGSRWPAFGVDSGAANAYAVATGAPLGPSLRTGSQIMFIATHANTTASTLAVNGGSAKAIKKNVSSALTGGEIPLNGVIVVYYDGTNFQLGGFANIACSQMPALTGDVTSSAGSCVTTVVKVNGVSYPTDTSTNTVPVKTSSGAVTYEALPNAALANASTTPNGQTCTLGSTCNVNSGASAHSLALNQGNGNAITGLLLGAHQTAIGTASSDPNAKTVTDCTDTGGNHLNFTQSTDAFSCGTSGGAPSGSAGGDLTGTYPNPTIASNAVTAAKSAVVLTRRTCMIDIGADNGSALVNADLGPQLNQCFVPFAATVVEVEVMADAGTPNVIVQRSHLGSATALLSGALATASAGAVACSNTGGTTGLDGTTTCTNTLQNTSVAVGDWIGLTSGTAGGSAKRMSIAVTMTVN